MNVIIRKQFVDNNIYKIDYASIEKCGSKVLLFCSHKNKNTDIFTTHVIAL